jgi:hypothetical protein
MEADRADLRQLECQSSNAAVTNGAALSIIYWPRSTPEEKADKRMDGLWTQLAALEAVGFTVKGSGSHSPLVPATDGPDVTNWPSEPESFFAPGRPQWTHARCFARRPVRLIRLCLQRWDFWNESFLSFARPRIES